MRISRYTDYALRVLMYAALRAPEIVTIDDVADDFDISRNHLVKVVHALGRAGFLATRRGIGGGFRLALPPEEINLGAVIRLTENDRVVVVCHDSAATLCRIFPSCRLKQTLGEADAAFFAVLDRYSLASLVKSKTELKKLLKI
jgi:Rrf2 family transcriptional regulator, nitric oxide-sensitive transcriptional repressor